MDHHENVDDIMIADINNYDGDDDDDDDNNKIKKQITKERWSHQELMQFSSHLLDWIRHNKLKNGQLKKKFYDSYQADCGNVRSIEKVRGKLKIMKKNWKSLESWEHYDESNEKLRIKMSDDDLRIMKSLKWGLENPDSIFSDDSDNSDGNGLEEEEENEEDIIVDEDDYEKVEKYESYVYESDLNTTSWFGRSEIYKTVLVREQRPLSENFEEAVILNVFVSHGVSFVTLDYGNGFHKDILNVESNFKEFVNLSQSTTIKNDTESSLIYDSDFIIDSHENVETTTSGCSFFEALREGETLQARQRKEGQYSMCEIVSILQNKVLVKWTANGVSEELPKDPNYFEYLPNTRKRNAPYKSGESPERSKLKVSYQSPASVSRRPTSGKSTFSSSATPGLSSVSRSSVPSKRSSITWEPGSDFVLLNLIINLDVKSFAFFKQIATSFNKNDIQPTDCKMNITEEQAKKRFKKIFDGNLYETIFQKFELNNDIQKESKVRLKAAYDFLFDEPKIKSSRNKKANGGSDNSVRRYSGSFNDLSFKKSDKNEVYDEVFEDIYENNDDEPSENKRAVKESFFDEISIKHYCFVQKLEDETCQFYLIPVNYIGGTIMIISVTLSSEISLASKVLNLNSIDFPVLSSRLLPIGTTAIDYYAICILEKTEGKKWLCYSPTLDLWFLTRWGAKKSDDRITKKLKKNAGRVDPMKIVVDDLPVTLFRNYKNEICSCLCTDIVFKNGNLVGKKGSTGTRVLTRNHKKRKKPLGKVCYPSRSSIGNAQFVAQSHPGWSELKTKEKIKFSTSRKSLTNETDKKTTVYIIQADNTRIRNNAALVNYSQDCYVSKLMTNYLLKRYQYFNRRPFNRVISDAMIQTALNEIDNSENIRPAIISALFEDTNWRLNEIHPVSSESIDMDSVMSDVDAVAADFSLIPIPSTQLDTKNIVFDYDIEMIRKMFKYIKETVFEGQFEETSVLIQSHVKFKKVRGHGYLLRKTEDYYQLFSNINVLFHVRIKFKQKLNPEVEQSIIWKVVHKAYAYFRKFCNQTTIASVHEATSIHNKWYTTSGPILNLMVVFMLAIHYPIECCLENYHGKTIVNFNAEEGKKEKDDILESLLRNFDEELPRLQKLAGFAILRLTKTVKNFLETNFEGVQLKKQPNVYIGIGCKIETSSRNPELWSPKLFSVINYSDCPYKFDHEELINSTNEYLPHMRSKNQNFRTFPIFGGCIYQNMQPQLRVPNDGEKFIDGSMDDVVRAQAYSPPVRFFDQQPINCKSINNYTIDKANKTVDLKKLSKNFSNWTEQLIRNIQYTKDFGLQGRIEITFDISNAQASDDQSIESLVRSKVKLVTEFSMQKVKSFEIGPRLETLLHVMNALQYKLKNYWDTLMGRPLHTDLYGDLWDTLTEITSLTWNFYSGRFPNSKPYLGDLQTYICRIILIPLGSECRQRRSIELKELYKQFQENVKLTTGLSHFLCVNQEYLDLPQTILIKPAPYQKPPKTNSNINGDTEACTLCQFVTIKRETIKYKHLHPCKSSESKTFCRLDSETFYDLHCAKVAMLSNEQLSFYRQALELDYLICVGQPGSGKTFVLKLIIERLFLIYGTDRIMPFAHDNDKANLISGNTLHNIFGFTPSTNFQLIANNDKELEKHCQYMIKYQERKVKIIQNLFQLCGDECSKISNKQIVAADKVARYIRKDDAPFGGIRMVLVGDFFQICPPEGDFMFKTELVSQNFNFCVLETIHRIKENKFQNILLQLRLRERRPSETIQFINNFFGPGTKLEHALFIQEMLYHCLVRYCVKENNALNRVNYLYNRTDILVYDTIQKKIYINLSYKVKNIKRLEQICSGGLEVSESNAEFFKDLPTTLCVQNDEVDYLNDQVNRRGSSREINYRHFQILVDDIDGESQKYVLRTFYIEQFVIHSLPSKDPYLARLIDINDDSITISNLKTKITIIINIKDLATLYPYHYFRTMDLSYQQFTEDADIYNIEGPNNNKQVVLRKGQRLFSKSSHGWSDVNPFINSTSKFILLGYDSDSRELELRIISKFENVCISVSTAFLFDTNEKDENGKMIVLNKRLGPGYAATVDFFQGHEEETYFVNPLRLDCVNNKEYILNKVIVFLSRSPHGEKVLLLFTLFEKHCEPSKLLLSFHEFISSKFNSGKCYIIDENSNVVADGNMIKISRRKRRNQCCPEFIALSSSILKLIDET